MIVRQIFVCSLVATVGVAAVACGNFDDGTGGGGGTGGTGAAVFGGDPLPIAVGWEWVYVDSFALASEVVKRITGTEQYGGQETFIWETTQVGSSYFRKRANIAVDGDKVTRLRQQRYCEMPRGCCDNLPTGQTCTVPQFNQGDLASTREYDPGFLRIDRARLRAVGDIVQESHARTERDASGTVQPDAFKHCSNPCGKQYTWTVLAIDSEVTVDAGTFTCLQVKRTDEGTTTSVAEDKIFWYAAGVGKVKERDELTGETEDLVRYTSP